MPKTPNHQVSDQNNTSWLLNGSKIKDFDDISSEQYREEEDHEDSVTVMEVEVPSSQYSQINPSNSFMSRGLNSLPQSQSNSTRVTP